MAGTRLLVHSSLLLPFLVLIALAFYFGLCRDGDLVCVPISRQSHEGRALLVLLQQQHSVTFDATLSFPPIQLLTVSSQVDFWNKALQESNNRITAVQDIDSQLPAACENPNGAVLSLPTITWSTALPQMWLCEHWEASAPEQARLVVRNGTAFFYPTTLSRRMAEWNSLLHPPPAAAAAAATARPVRLERLQLTVWLDEERTDAKLWMTAVYTWLEQSRFSSWPCWKTVKVDFKVVQGSNDFTTAKLIPGTLLDDGSEANVTIAATKRTKSHPVTVTEELMSPLLAPRDTWNVALYIPQNDAAVPTTIPDRITTQSGLWTTVLANEPVDLPEYTELAATALDAAADWLVRRCMVGQSLPPNSSNHDRDHAAVIWDSDGSFPAFYLHLWFQRYLTVEYAALVTALERERTLLLAKPRTVAIPAAIADSFHRAVALVEHATTNAASGDYYPAMDALDHTGVLLRLLQTDPALQEPLDFPWDQYAAIFAPLLVPLLLPLLAGLVREVQRYRKLKHGA